MRTLKLCTLLLTTSFLSCTKPENFTQCQKNEALEIIVEKLAKDAVETKEQLAILITLLQAERAEKLKLLEEQQERLQKKHVERLAQDAEIQKIQNQLNNLPWYARYSLVAALKIQPIITDQIWPLTKQIIISMIAQKCAHGLLDLTDFTLGDIPQRVLPRSIGNKVAMRPGEFLTTSSQHRKIYSFERDLLLNDPEYKQTTKEITTLEKEVTPDVLRAQRKAELERLQTLKQNRGTMPKERPAVTMNVVLHDGRQQANARPTGTPGSFAEEILTTT